MFETQFENLKITFNEVKGTGMFLALYIVAILYLFFNEKDEKRKRLFCYSSVLIVFIVMNPIFNKLVGGVFRKTIYWRFFWCLPIGFTLGYVGTMLVKNIDVDTDIDNKKTNTKIKKIIVGVVLSVLIMISGKLVFNDTNYQKVNNWYKHTDEDVFIAHQIAIDNEEYKRVICPMKLNNHLRQIEPSLVMAYPRVASGDYKDYPPFFGVMTGNVEFIDKYATDNDFNYVIFEKSITLTAPMENAGFHLIYETEHYRVYKK
ncbi:MAG: hypothetical protein K6D97_09275 [Clostridia bacterium]|nr:hypothetical protein [Clostridia bacterium]